MRRFEYLKLVFSKALSKYGMLKTLFGIGLTILFVLNQEAGKYLTETWKGVSLPWALLITTVIFGFFFFDVSFEIAKSFLNPTLQITSDSGDPFEHFIESYPLTFVNDSPAEKPKSWPMKLFRIQLENLGGQTIRNIEVRLKSIEPKPDYLHVPLNLRKMHDHPEEGAPLQTSFDLAPYDKAYFDVLQLDIGTNITNGELEITHTVKEINAHIPRKNYKLTVEAVGHNTQPTENTFNLNLDDLNNPTFQEEA